MSRAPRLSIMIPTWNNLAMLKLCLASIAKYSEIPHQVVIHVNDGRDGTLDWVRRNGLTYTHTPWNIGICRALNLAAERCTAEYWAYLNDDMIVLPGWDRTLYECVVRAGSRELAYVSGTMIQRTPMAPSAVLADYGSEPGEFDEAGLMYDFSAGKLSRDDWNGATWPPCCIHRKWWRLVGGYSEEFSPGFYSDIDFSMKLWRAGCRRFYGVGSSLVYHFGEKTTSLVRGPHKENVKRARLQFLEKWGILPSTFIRHYLRAGQSFRERTFEPDGLQSGWDHVRSRMLAGLRRVVRFDAA